MVQSLDRGIKILEILEQRKSAGVTEIALELEINKSTAFRLLDTLRLNNLVEQDPVTEKYKLSGGILRFSNAFLSNTSTIRLARPYMEELSGEVKESVHLCVFSNGHVTVVDQVKSLEMVKVNAAIGREEAIFCTAVGKSVLAFIPEAERKRILDSTELVAYTEKTITDRSKLEENLAVVHSRGYAIDDEEITPGVRCIAAPIFNHVGRVVYSVGISALASRIQDGVIEEYAGRVKRTADIISEKLGFH